MNTWRWPWAAATSFSSDPARWKAAPMSKARERGAVAVEFALLAPILIMLLLGIMEFGRAYNVQISLTNAAREGVRVMAIDSSNPTAALTATKNAADTLSPKLVNSNITIAFQTIPQTTPAPTSC